MIIDTSGSSSERRAPAVITSGTAPSARSHDGAPLLRLARCEPMLAKDTSADGAVTEPLRAPVVRDPAVRVRRPFLVTACVAYLLVTIALWILLRQQGDRWWVGTLLLLSPRWLVAVPLAVLAPWILLTRRWHMGMITGGAALIVLWPLLGLRVALPSSAGERGDLRIVSCNVHRQHMDAAKLAAYLAEVQPDVVALQDWSSSHDNLFAGAEWHVRREGELFVASRWPIGEVTPLAFPALPSTPQAERGAAASFELLLPAAPVHLINVHLASPHSGLLTFRTDGGRALANNAERRWEQSDAVRTLADRLPGAVLVAGDFNTTDDSPLFREHWGEFTDGFAARGSGLGYTYLNDHTQLRIDHIVASPSWTFTRFELGPAVGSPHRPLLADLELE
ncbi:MAG: endonuclease/exonuclease/phosphatase family protein [Phycisphaerae bacterium]|nr:endonuclease/exonuclease/phosphatase family protein [Phycisphaerae bacterium]